MGNLHENLTDPSQVHPPLKFPSALTNTYLTKDENDGIRYDERNFLPSVLDIVDSSALPPTQVVNDVYILDKNIGALDVNTITFIAGNSIEYAFNGAPDLSAFNPIDVITFSNSTNAINDGRFVLDSVDNILKKVTITNFNRVDGTDDEAADSPSTATIGLLEWSGHSNDTWVRWNGENWGAITPTQGMLTYVKAADKDTFYNYDGTDWVRRENFAEQFPIKITIDFDDASLFVAAGAADTVIFTLPPGYRMWASIIPPLPVAFDGAPAFANYDISVGITADPDKYGKLISALIVGGTRELDRRKIESWTLATDIKLFASANQDLNLATQGSIEVYLFVTKVKQ